MTWTVLDKSALATFLEAIKTSAEAPLFSPLTCEARRMSLPFYEGVQLYRLTSYAAMPSFSLYYLCDGPRFFYLDGTVEPLLTVARSGALRLTEANIIAYLNFYFTFVTPSEGEIFLVHDPEAYPYQDEARFDSPPSLSFGGTAPVYDVHTGADGALRVDTPLFSDGTLVRSLIEVDSLGRVEILRQQIQIRTSASDELSRSFSDHV